MSKKHCMFQYATGGRYANVKIHEDTGLITWEEAVKLWEKQGQMKAGDKSKEEQA